MSWLSRKKFATADSRSSSLYRFGALPRGATGSAQADLRDRFTPAMELVLSAT